MDNPLSVNRLPGAWELLTQTWRIFIAHWRFFIIVSGVGQLVATLFSYATPYFVPTYTPESVLSPTQIASFVWFFLVMIVVCAVFTWWSSVATILALHENKFDDPIYALESVGSRYFKYFFAVLLSSVVIGLGFILLIIPGIIFSVWYFFSGIVAVIENTTAWESMKISKSYVKGQWWAIMWRFLVSGLFMVLASFLFGFLVYFLNIPLAFLPDPLMSAAIMGLINLFFYSAIYALFTIFTVLLYRALAVRQ